MCIIFSCFSERSSNRSLEQNSSVIQMLSDWRWAARSYLEVLVFCSEETILMDMVDFLSVSVTLSQRYAVSPTQATRHRWREDHHSEPNRPTKVPLSRTEYYRPILRENQSCGVLIILIQCVSHPVSGLNKRFKNHQQKPKDTSPLSAFGQMCCY